MVVVEVTECCCSLLLLYHSDKCMYNHPQIHHQHMFHHSSISPSLSHKHSHIHSDHQNAQPDSHTQSYRHLNYCQLNLIRVHFDRFRCSGKGSECKHFLHSLNHRSAEGIGRCSCTHNPLHRHTYPRSDIKFRFPHYKHPEVHHIVSQSSQQDIYRQAWTGHQSSFHCSCSSPCSSPYHMAVRCNQLHTDMWLCCHNLRHRFLHFDMWYLCSNLHQSHTECQ